MFAAALAAALVGAARPDPRRGRGGRPRGWRRWFAARACYGANGTVVSPVEALLGLAIGAVTTVGTQLAAERRRADAEHDRREQAQKLIVQTLTTLTETRDVDTGRHARRTQEYVRLLASTLAAKPAYRRVLTPDRIDLLATLAPLHDIGKVGISDAVLNKPGHLTADEYAEMKQHATLGHDSLLKAEHLAGVHDNEVISLAKDIVYTHHERWDGSGYPRGLRGTAIPLAGRLVAVVDVFDAVLRGPRLQGRPAARAGPRCHRQGPRHALRPRRRRRVPVVLRPDGGDPAHRRAHASRPPADRAGEQPASADLRSASTPASPPPAAAAPASSPRRG